MTKTLYLIRETEKARQFSTKAEGWPHFWVPRSVIVRMFKWPPEEGKGPFRRCDVTIADWWARVNPIGNP